MILFSHRKITAKATQWFCCAAHFIVTSSAASESVINGYDSGNLIVSALRLCQSRGSFCRIFHQARANSVQCRCETSPTVHQGQNNAAGGVLIFPPRCHGCVLDLLRFLGDRIFLKKSIELQSVFFRRSAGLLLEETYEMLGMLKAQ